ncbi:hypothetical protein [Phenylobacterium sp.]|jgi:hypothetical protein|uniref:hypothetical protein n=1 Tax=Phenylobacterium sp. TaxID=1871053 RepID=UPI002F3F0EBF
MSEFKPTEAALEGFRLARKNPKAFRTWIVLNLAVSVLAVMIDVFMPAEIRHGLDTLNGPDTLTLRQFADAMILAAPVLVLALAVIAMMAAAVYRLIFRHADDRFGYVRLGPDEFRLMGTTVICSLILILAVVGATVGMGIVFGLIGLFVPQLSAILTVLGPLVIVGVAAFTFVRLSLAPAATFAEQKVVVFESWTLTKGHFWGLLGAYALAIACIATIWILVIFICFGVTGSIVLIEGGQLSEVKSLLTATGGSLTSYLSVGVIAYGVVNSVLSALYYSVMAAPGAVAYQQLHGWPPEGHPLTIQPEAG